jgi:hypothetical protein
MEEFIPDPFIRSSLADRRVNPLIPCIGIEASLDCQHSFPRKAFKTEDSMFESLVTGRVQSRPPIEMSVEVVADKTAHWQMLIAGETT